MDIIMMARAIGLRMKETDQAKAYYEAKEAYENSEEISAAMTEYQIQQDMLERQEDEDGEPMDEHTLTRVSDRIDELYDFISTHPLFTAFEQAEKELNDLIRTVNGTILAQITGKFPTNCSSDCSSCSGCS